MKIHIVVFLVLTSCSLAGGCPPYKTYTRVHIFSKNLESPATPRCQKGDRKQVAYLGPWILKWPVNLTVIWCFLPGACELMHIFVFKERNFINNVASVSCHQPKFSDPGNQVPRFFASQPFTVLYLRRPQCEFNTRGRPNRRLYKTHVFLILTVFKLHLFYF